MMRKICLVLWLSVLAGSPLFAQEWARKTFNKTSHDFGTIARGAKAEYAFVLKNRYLEDMHIASVRSSCSCAKPRIEKPWLKTYEQGAIIAAINSGAFAGRKSATLTVTIDKPYYAQVQLNVRVHIRNDIVLEPGSVQLGSVEQGKAADQQITVSCARRKTWKIVDVKSANPHIAGHAVRCNQDGARVVYDLRVRLDEDAPVGYIKDHLMLITNDRSRSQFPVLVEGRVCAGLTVSPASLFMGVVPSGDKVTKRLVVRGEKPFRIVSIGCDDGSFKFDMPNDREPKLVHLIPVTFVAGPNSGKVARTIRIKTDLGKTVPELAAYAVVSTP